MKKSDKIQKVEKLEDEKQNLVRVSDILSELEKQIGPLEKQSEVAKVYLKKKEELKTLDVNVFLLENNRLQEQLKSADEKYTIANNDLETTSEQYEKIKEEYEQIQGQIEMLDESIEQSRSMLTDTSVLRGKLEGEINVLKEQIHSASSNDEHLSNRLAAVQAEIDETGNHHLGSLTHQKLLQPVVAQRGILDEYLSDDAHLDRRSSVQRQSRKGLQNLPVVPLDLLVGYLLGLHRLDHFGVFGCEDRAAYHNFNTTVKAL